MSKYPLEVTPLGNDIALQPYIHILDRRRNQFLAARERLTGSPDGSLAEYAAKEHFYFGLHKLTDDSWIFREWAPAAKKIVVVGDFSNFEEQTLFEMQKAPDRSGCWVLKFKPGILQHNMHYQLHIYFADGSMGVRLPAYSTYTVQDPVSNIFSAKVYDPNDVYKFHHDRPARTAETLIYEAHVGMAQEAGKVGSFNEFTENILPRIAQSNYNTIQLMAVMNHPYYGSFGYHVANFFSIASCFGTPDELKKLIDTAHSMNLRVIMDVIHSHAVRNEIEGLGKFDGTREQYFYPGEQGEHSAWGSLCFNYSKDEVVKFLLSNLRFYLEEYNLDGFRFDGVTSMIYTHHGLNRVFGNYEDYFSDDVNESACCYLALANTLIHELRPDALTIAEDVSGMPGVAAKVSEGGMGFDIRLAMGVTDLWFKLFDQRDEKWDIAGLFHELLNRRSDERCISYVECHDQAIVGGQTAIFRLAGSDIYTNMSRSCTTLKIERAIALHKLARLITAATGCSGYLNFMGNEFGHPEWIDFPREGNLWSYHYARRQWSLADNEELLYYALNEFDKAMLDLLTANDIWSSKLRKLKLDNCDKIIAFERSNLWFFFNFNSQKSFTDYAVEVMPGKYQLLLDSDEIRFGGHQRLYANQYYFTIPEKSGNILKHELKLYLPTRTALILKKID